jgi:hypothetical protein
MMRQSFWQKSGTSLVSILLLAVTPFAQDFDRRARDIVRQMTLDEKIQQLHGIRDDAHYLQLIADRLQTRAPKIPGPPTESIVFKKKAVTVA